METVSNFFFYQWQRKLLALVTAIIIWIFVSQSITASKTIPQVPIRVINLPADKTITGLLSNGFLGKRTSITLTGTKDVINQLEPGDVEVILDVSNLPNDGIVQITKKNLVSLNPNFNLPKHVTSVGNSELVIKMSPILNEKIPILIHPPLGSAPKGYEFLDIWPINLSQSVSGPQDQVLNLKNQGLELTFNLDNITKEELDSQNGKGLYNDEISFNVPDSWKRIEVPFFSTQGTEEINDPEAKNLQIHFLRKQLLPIPSQLPIHVFYPLKYSATINPDTYPLISSPFVKFKNQLPILTIPLFGSNVSKLFLEVVKDNIELDIVAAPASEREKLEWGISFIDEAHLEDTYVAFLLSDSKSSDSLQNKNRGLEEHFRERFRLYLQKFTLYLSLKYKLELESKLEDGKIRVHVPNAFLLNNARKADAR
jgi:hypothetical protein